MKILSRVSATIMGSMDNAVSRVENHDAVVEAGIKEIRKSAASARVRLARVQRDGQRMADQQRELRINESDWLRRAKAVGDADEQRALECLRRRNLCLQKITDLDQSLEEHRALEDKLRNELSKIESRLKEISIHRNRMKSRQSVAEATRILSSVNGEGGRNIEDTFDRWESVIIDSEILNDDVIDTKITDEFAYQFESTEKDATLKQELSSLLSGGGESNHESQ